MLSALFLVLLTPEPSECVCVEQVQHGVAW